MRATKRHLGLWLYLVGLGLGLGLGLGETGCKRLGAKGTDQNGKETSLLDRDYQFRLSLPGPKWKLLSEKEIGRMVPGAAAGASESGNGARDRHGAVLVESFPKIEMRAYADLLISNMPLSDKRVEFLEDIVFQKQKAVRYRVSGIFNGLSVVYENLVFHHKEHAYQVLSWGLKDQADGQSLAAFANSFQLLDGPVQDRERSAQIADQRGPTYQVKEGVFRSASCGVSLAPPKGWHLTVGNELTSMNANAEVGMVRKNPEAYLVIIPENIGKQDPKRYLATSLRLDRDDPGIQAAENPVEVQIAGHGVTLKRYRHTTQPFEYLQGGFVHGEIAYNVLLWYGKHLGDKVAPLVQPTVSAISLLGPDEQKRLQNELDALPDSQSAVGAGYSLRRGVYRDYASGIVWRKPKGAFRIVAGDEARQRNKDASLYLEETQRGLYGMLITEPATLAAPAYQAAVAKGAKANGLHPQAPIPAKVGGKSGFVHKLQMEAAGIPILQHVYTAAEGERGYQVLLWGTPDKMASMGPRLQELLSGFEFYGPARRLPAVEWKGAAIADYRLGYRFAPPEPGLGALAHKDATPESVRAIGTFTEWTNKDYKILVLAIYTMGVEQNEAWFLEQLKGVAKPLLPFFGSHEEREDRLAGEPAKRLTFRGLGTIRGEVLVVERDRTFYALTMDATAGKPINGELFEAVKQGFGFLP